MFVFYKVEGASFKFKKKRKKRRRLSVSLDSVQGPMQSSSQSDFVRCIPSHPPTHKKKKNNPETKEKTSPVAYPFGHPDLDSAPQFYLTNNKQMRANCAKRCIREQCILSPPRWSKLALSDSDVVAFPYFFSSIIQSNNYPSPVQTLLV